MAEIGERHDGAPADAQHVLEHAAADWRVAWMVCDRMT